TPDALRGQAERLLAHLADRPDIEPADVGYSLATTRTAFAYRAVVVGQDRDGFLRALDALAHGRGDPSLVRGVARASGRAVFVCPGQGTQWIGMAVELLASAPVFAERIAACERALAPHVDWSLLEVLRDAPHDAPDAPPLDRVDVVQPVLFSVM